jgi:pyrroloquinoline quinone biosynthesis protein E
VTDQAAILPEPPMGLLAELTHRCPLQCPYCANPLELERASAELDSATWLRVLEQAAALGILQVHFSGGEPTARKDLVLLVRRAAELELYSNLITSGVLLDSALVSELVRAGLDHVQLSFQHTDPSEADRLGGLRGGHAGKLRAAALVRGAGLPLTLNFVVHRQNLAHMPAIIALAETLGAGRIEIAHVQYYGWGLVNRAALLPTRAQVDAATDAVEAARERLKGRIIIDYVPPDYYAKRPKACMGGWARRLINITPSGRVLPCHAAETLPGFDFPSVRDNTLSEIWRDSPLFRRFRRTAWMPEPCRSCDRREIDWGGCRCQAFALTGDAANTDPVCTLASTHRLVADALRESEGTTSELVYRRIGAASHAATAAPVAAK